MKKIHHIAVNHDYIKAFVITYVFLSAVIAIFLGLFYFLLWILFHYILELYKRYHLFSKLWIDDFLIALQHCRWDFVFFFIALNVELIYHYVFVLAPGAVGAFLRMEKGLVEEIRVLEIAKALPRAVGMAKTSKSVYEIAHELLHEKYIQEKKHFSMERNDWIALGITILCFFITGAVLTLHGENVLKIVEGISDILKP